jgi:uncharacterized protein (DUF58 family)
VPTVRGWLTVGIALGLWSAGRVLGVRPLEQLAFALIVLVIAAVVLVNMRRHDLSVERRVVPERARAGQKVEVRLRILNLGRGSAPLMLLDDAVPLELSGHSRFAVNGIEPGGDRDTGYELRPPRRGRYQIGPLSVHFIDPFGLAQTRSHLAEPSALLVHPRMEELGMPRDLGHHRTMSTSALRQFTAARGEDFFTLREYVEGDDLRRIHWPSTAKRNKPMIRQEETPWHTRATIVLDDRRAGVDTIGEPAAFERAVEGAASLCDLYRRSGYTYRLLGAVHPGVAGARDTEHFHRCLDLLATIQSQLGHEEALLTRLAELQVGNSAEGTLVVVTTDPTPALAQSLAGCRRRWRTIIVLAFPRHRFGLAATRDRWGGEQVTFEAVTLLHRSGIRTLVLGPGESIVGAWGSLSRVRREAARGGV